MNEKQIQSFKKFTKNKNAELSLCNSAGILNYPQYFFYYVRPGLNGASPINNKTGLDFGLKPIMTLKSKIISVNRLKKGQSIGYNAQFTLTKDTTVGVVAGQAAVSTSMTQNILRLLSSISIITKFTRNMTVPSGSFTFTKKNGILPLRAYQMVYQVIALPENKLQQSSETSFGEFLIC